jgi:hypothetical protein
MCGLENCYYSHRGFQFTFFRDSNTEVNLPFWKTRTLGPPFKAPITIKCTFEKFPKEGSNGWGGIIGISST